MEWWQLGRVRGLKGTLFNGERRGSSWVITLCSLLVEQEDPPGCHEYPREFDQGMHELKVVNVNTDQNFEMQLLT